MKLQTKLIILICFLILFVVISLESLFLTMTSRTIKEQIGTRALSVAESVASIPDIKKAFNDPEPWKTIQPIVEGIRAKTNAEFIVVGNKAGIRYSHPIPERIGRAMVGGDNGPALSGKSSISEAIGSLGPSIRGKTPIFDDSGNVIGLVSVGFLLEDIETITSQYNSKFMIMGIVLLALGILGAILIARSVKKATWGLEPKEIGSLYQEKQAILQAIKEGMVAVDSNGIITTLNHTAVEMLHLPNEADLKGKYILDVIPGSRLLEVIKWGKAEYDQEMLVGDHVVIVNRIPITDSQNRVIGAVSTFRSRSELYRLSQELSQVKRYAEALRAQTHEYSNKLYLVSGLIQLESYQEAIELITRESNIHQNLVRFIMKEVPDPIIGGLLIGKFNRANERKVKLEIDPQSSFRDVPETISRDHLVTIIGNIIDNAMDSVQSEKASDRKVNVFLTDIGDDLIIEVEDWGTGVPVENREKIFEIGFSSKSEKNRGYGLDLVKKALDQLNGYITYSDSPSGGAVFTVAIPKSKSIS